MLPIIIGRISRLTQTSVVNKHDLFHIKSEEQGNRPANSLVLSDKGKSFVYKCNYKGKSSVNLSYPSLGKHPLPSSPRPILSSPHPLRAWKTSSGTPDVFQSIVDSQSPHFFPSPDRGLANIFRELSRVRSSPVNYSTPVISISSLSVLFPCLSVGFAAWWGLIPDQVIISNPTVALLDPSLLLCFKDGLVEGASSGALSSVVEQGLSPQVSPEVGAEADDVLSEIQSSIREAKYGSAAVLLLGAVAALVLLSGSGSGSARK